MDAREYVPVEDQAAQPWMKYAGMVESGNPNSSQTMDEIVYIEMDFVLNPSAGLKSRAG